MSTALSDTDSEFVERMGLLAQSDGLPRITGRIWGLFMISGEDMLSFSDIADALQISRGSVSTNARTLVSLGVLERRARPGERQDYYAIRDNPYLTLLETTLARQREKATMVRAASRAARRAGPKAKLAQLADFYDALNEGLQSSLDTLEPTRRGER